MNYVNILKSKRKLYSYSVNYNSFQNITQDKIEEIKEKVRKKYEGEKCVPEAVFQYLSGPTIQSEIADYDEKILFLIMALDPELELYKFYMNTEIISNSAIQRADEEDKEKLRLKRKKQIDNFMSEARSKFPFFDKSLLSYESDLARILKSNSLFSGIKFDAISKIIESAHKIKDFDNVTDDDLEKLKTTSNIWLTAAEDTSDYNTLAYNILKNPSLFKINTLHEQVLMFILLVDPNFDMIRITEEESTEESIKKRCVEEFGFYDLHLTKLEKKYHDKFFPDVKVSIWEY